MSHSALMDGVYRYQRHFYDATRRFFLFGRDTLLRLMDVSKGDRVLEIGCGTARNLVRIGRHHPGAFLYGLDASREMLNTAERNLAKAGLDGRGALCHCLAEDLDHHQTFGLDERFDVVFFSYALTMIPQCVEALDAALANLRPGRALYIVDFWDQGGFPNWFRSALTRWLELFHVRHRPEVLEHLADLQRRGVGTLGLRPVGNRYAYLARFTKH